MPRACELCAVCVRALVEPTAHLAWTQAYHMQMIDTLPLSLRPILLQERKKLHWDWATFIFTATDPLGDTVLELSVCSEGGGAARRAAALESKRLGLPESLDLSCWQRAQSLTASRLHPGRMKSGEVKLHEAFLHDDVLKWNTAENYDVFSPEIWRTKGFKVTGTKQRLLKTKNLSVEKNTSFHLHL